MVEIANKNCKRVKPLKRIFLEDKTHQKLMIVMLRYIFGKKIVLNFRLFISQKLVLYVMPEERSWDIDNNFDFKIVQFLLKKKMNYLKKTNSTRKEL